MKGFIVFGFALLLVLKLSSCAEVGCREAEEVGGCTARSCYAAFPDGTTALVRRPAAGESTVCPIGGAS